MPTDPSNPPRACGECTLCCRAPAIVPLNKPAGIACSFLNAHGCSVYHDRTAPRFRDCVSFTCLWIQDRYADADRPDRLGVIFSAKPDPDAPGRNRIFVTEQTPLAANAPRVRELIQQHLADNQTVAITNQHYVIAILPTGDSWQYPIDPADPLHSRVDPATVPVRLTIHGRPVQTSPPIPSLIPSPATAAPAESPSPTRRY